ncbi:heme biosynthesis HemY N-terminal domain-containing protein [Marinibactrum halimedae]|uniref:HemY N-terminal domain-containing protein n=1 Tax=Marinibactrum halimedae TaxID=1444977 RepID=A0AA37TBI4_9GAMM|nr:heme biosynthesis HemY N-terminal domain-containing protein [Marinibactrum halimedae]MCD9458303.1 metal-dependent phosphohydrolase [Marinibactrum halimedae]GLS27070.1 hypothetical protein GCM10007877_27890 [Marinibactrum halimedae]
MIKNLLYRVFFWLFLIVFFLWAIYQVVTSTPGYVAISINRYTVETTFWVAIALNVALFLTLVLIWKSIKRTRRVMIGSVSWMRHGNPRSAQRATTIGLLEFLEGNWRPARKQLLKGAKRVDNPLLNYLAAARCAYELGEEETVGELLNQAEQRAPKNTLAVALTQARMQLIAKKYEPCIATLERARKAKPNHPVVLGLLSEAYMGVGDWKALQKLLPQLKQRGHMSEEEWAALSMKAVLERLESEGDLASRLSSAEAVKHMEQVWQELPAQYRKDVAVIASFVQQLVRNGGDASAEQVLRKTLREQWDARLVRFYGMVSGENVNKQLSLAESWLNEHPDDKELCLALGRISLRNELWGKAREYFERSLKLAKNPEAYAELARLLAHLGEHRLSTQYYQEGLILSTAGLPVLPMPKSVTEH